MSNIAYRHWNLLKVTAIFIASLMEKNIYQFLLPLDRFFVNLLADRKAVDGFNTKILSA